MDEVLINILQEYVATANSGKYTSWEEINSKFPELKDYDPVILEQYVATANSGKYSDWATINSKFPEFNKTGEPKGVKAEVESGGLDSASAEVTSSLDIDGKPKKDKPVTTFKEEDKEEFQRSLMFPKETKRIKEIEEELSGLPAMQTNKKLEDELYKLRQTVGVKVDKKSVMETNFEEEVIVDTDKVKLKDYESFDGFVEKNIQADPSFVGELKEFALETFLDVRASTGKYILEEWADNDPRTPLGEYASKGIEAGERYYANKRYLEAIEQKNNEVISDYAIENNEEVRQKYTEVNNELASLEDRLKNKRLDIGEISEIKDKISLLKKKSRVLKTAISEADRFNHGSYDTWLEANYPKVKEDYESKEKYLKGSGKDKDLEAHQVGLKFDKADFLSKKAILEVRGLKREVIGIDTEHGFKEITIEKANKYATELYERAERLGKEYAKLPKTSVDERNEIVQKINKIQELYNGIVTEPKFKEFINSYLKYADSEKEKQSYIDYENEFGKRLIDKEKKQAEKDFQHDEEGWLTKTATIAANSIGRWMIGAVDTAIGSFVRGGEYGALEQGLEKSYDYLEQEFSLPSQLTRSFYDRASEVGDLTFIFDDKDNITAIREKKTGRSLSGIEFAFAQKTWEDLEEKPAIIEGFNFENIGYKTINGLVDMVSLVRGGGMMSKGIASIPMLGKIKSVNDVVGLTASGMAVENHQLYTEAMATGKVSRSEANAFAFQTSLFVAALENISPNRALLGMQVKQLKKTALDLIVKGIPPKKALSKAFNHIKSEIPKEVLQEHSQAGGTRLAKIRFNESFKENVFDTEIDKAEVWNTTVATVSTTFFSSGVGAYQQYRGAQNMYNRYSKLQLDGINAILNTEDNKPIFSELDKMVEDGRATKEEADRAKDFINNLQSVKSDLDNSLIGEESKPYVAILLAEKNKLELQKKNTNKVFHKKIDEKIAEIDKGIQEILDFSAEATIEDKETAGEKLGAIVTPETSSNYANLTEEGDNFVFFHRGKKGYDEVKVGTGESKVTSREEAAAMGKVGGLAMYYTQATDSERQGANDAQYAVKVPKEKVYDFNSDPQNLIEEAKERHKKEHPNKAFDLNTQLAYVTKIAGEKGFDMVVAEWDGKTRAQTTKNLKPSDIREMDGDRVTKEFEGKYESNREKGFESVIPKTKEAVLKEVYDAIYKERNKVSKYDKLYHLYTSHREYTQDEITKMIEESDLSQEVKDQYKEALAYESEGRSSRIVEKTKPVDVKESTKGTYVNVGMRVGKTNQNLSETDITNALPEDVKVEESGVKEVESEGGIEKTLSLKLSRPLTDLEMKEFLKATGQMAIPQLSDGKGVMYGTKDWGDFNPEYFSMPDGKQLKETEKIDEQDTKDTTGKPTEKGKTDTEGQTQEGADKGTTKDVRQDKERREVVLNAVKNAKKALAKIAPNVKINVYNTYNEYAKAVGESVETEGGEWNPTTNTISINLDSANARTVAHEVFHAVLGVKLNSDKAIQGITDQFIKVLSKNVDSDIRAELNRFAAGYKNPNIRSEEALAEFTGMLASNYTKLSNKAQSTIKKWLDALTKKFGLKQFTDAEVIDLLNTLASKVATGEVITESDVKLFTELDNGGIAVTPNPKGVSKQKGTKVRKSIFKEADFTQKIPTRTLSDVLKGYQGKVFLVQSDATKVGYDSKGKKILGGFGYTAIKSNIKDKVGFASKDLGTSKSTVSKLKGRYNVGDKVAVLIMLQNPSSTLGNSYGATYFGRVIEQMMSKPNYPEMAQSIITWVDSHKGIIKALKKNKTYDKLKELILNPSSIEVKKGESFEEAFTREFVMDTSFDVRRTMLNSLVPSTESVRTNKNTPAIKVAMKEAGFNKMDFYKEYGDSSVITEDMYLNDDGGYVVAGFETEVSESYHENMETKGVSHPLFNGKIESTGKHFLLDGLYDVQENFIEFSEMETQIAPTKKEEANRRIKTKYNVESYKKLKDTQKIEFKNNNKDLLIKKIPHIPANVSRGMNWFPSVGVEQELAESTPTKTVRKQLSPEEAYKKSEEMAEKAREQASGENKSLRDRVRGFMNNITDKILDRQGSVKKALDKVGMSLVVDYMVTKSGYSSHAKNLSEKVWKKVFEGLSDKDIKKLEEIILHRRIIAVDTNREARKLNPIKHPDGFDKNSSEAALQGIKDKLGDKKYNDLEKRAEAYFKQYNDILTEMKDEGLITEETYELFAEVEYSPTVFLDFLEDMDGNLLLDEVQKTEKNPLSGKQIQSMKGGHTGSQLMDAWYLIQKSLLSRSHAVFTNRMNRTFADEFAKIKKEVEELKGKTILTKAEERKIKNFERVLENVVEDKIVGFTESGNPKYERDGANNKGLKPLYYYKNGVRYRIWLKEDFHQKFTDTNNQYLNANTKEAIALGSGTAVVKTLATGNNPLFFITNTPRDFAFVIAFSKEYSSNVLLSSIQLFGDMVKGVKDVVNNSENYDKFLQYGGGMDYLAIQGKFNHSGAKKMIDLALDTRTQDKFVKNKLKRTLDKFNLASEMGIRLAVFNKSIKNHLNGRKVEDLSKEEQDIMYTKAVRAARELTDFNQGGKVIKALDAGIPYLNAATQGTRVAFNNLAERPAETTFRIAQLLGYTSATFLGAAMGAISLFRSGDDEEDKDKTNAEIYFETLDGVSRYDLENYFIIPLGYRDDRGEWKYFRVAKAQSLTPMINATEHYTRKALSEASGIKYEQDLGKTMLSTVNNNLLPLSLDPVENVKKTPAVGAAFAMMGIDSYTGNPLDWKRGEIPEELEGITSDRVEPVFLNLSEAMGVSPIRLQKAVEAMVTTPNTNPYIGVAYAMGNLTASNRTVDDVAEDFGSDLLKAGSRRFLKSTSEYNRVSKMEERVDKEVVSAYKKHILMEKDVRDVVRELKEDKDFDKAHKKIVKIADGNPEMIARLKSWVTSEVKKKQTRPLVSALKFERNKEVKALLLIDNFGDMLLPENRVNMDENEKKLAMELARAGVFDKETAMHYMNLLTKQK